MAVPLSALRHRYTGRARLDGVNPAHQHAAVL